MGNDAGTTVEVVQVDQLPVAYNVTDAAIAELHERFDGMTADDSKGYNAVTKAIAEVRTLRTGVEKRRKELKRDALEYGRAVDSVAKEITARLLEVEEPLKATKQVVDDEKARVKAEEEAREQERLETHRRAIGEIRAMVFSAASMSSDQIGELIQQLEVLPVEEAQFEEFAEDAKTAKYETMDKLLVLQEEAEKREDEAEALARMKAEQEAKERTLAEERAELEREKAAEAERQAEEQRKIDEEKLRLRLEREAKERAERELAEQGVNPIAIMLDLVTRAGIPASDLDLAGWWDEREIQIPAVKQEREAKEAAAAEAEAQRRRDMAPDAERLRLFATGALSLMIEHLPVVGDPALESIVDGIRGALEELRGSILADLAEIEEADNAG